MKIPSPLEKHDQMAFCSYMTLKHIPHFSIANGGNRNVLEAISLRQQGVSAGVPDLMVPVSSSGYHGLFIEMKRKGCTLKDVTKKQREWHKILIGNGYCVLVCFGLDAAIKSVEDYLSHV